MKSYASSVTVYAVIGDLVGSRRLAAREEVQRALPAALARVDARVPSLDGLAPTVGDEFQGVYRTVEDAVGATQQLRLELLPVVDTRYGIGAGERRVLDATRTPAIEDGSAWWAARAAIDALGGHAARHRRGWYDAGTAPDAAPAALVNALLLTRDALTDRLDPTWQQGLLALLGGASQTEVARLVGVSPSAVSQQVARGLGAVRDAHLLLAAAPPPDATPGPGAC